MPRPIAPLSTRFNRGSGRPAGQLVLSIYLSKAANLIRLIKRPDLEGEALRKYVNQTHPISLDWGPPFAERSTQAEAETLWHRFEKLDARLQSDKEQFTPRYQSGPMQYYFERMPDDFTMEAFLAGWM